MTHRRIELILVNYWNSNLLLCRYVLYQSNPHLILRNAWFIAYPGWNGPCYSASSTSCIPENLYYQRSKSQGHQLRSHLVLRKIILRPKKCRIEGRNQMPIKKFVKKWSLRLPTYITDEQRPNVDSPLIQVITLQDSQQKPSTMKLKPVLQTMRCSWKHWYTQWS